MKNLSFKNIFQLFLFNFRICRKKIIGWSIAIFSIMFLYMILFPYVQDIAEVKFDALPKEMLQFMGMQNLNEMSNYNTYYGMLINMILVAVAIFSATFSAALIVKEEKTKSIEFLNALAVSRVEIFISKYCVSLIASSLILMTAVISTIICGFAVGGETFELMDIITTIKISGFGALFFGGIAFMLSGISVKLGTGGIVSGVILISYLLGFLGEILGEKGEFLISFSPFISFNYENALMLSDKLILTLGIYYLIYIVSLFLGGYFYNKRDLSI